MAEKLSQNFNLEEFTASSTAKVEGKIKPAKKYINLKARRNRSTICT